MLDAIRPWFYILWGAAFLVPLLLKRRIWLTTPICRAEEPARFWLQRVFVVVVIAMGAYEAWSLFYGG